MKNTVSKNVVNELLKNLGHNNISVVETPVFHWNGSEVTNDMADPIKLVVSYMLNEDFTFPDFLKAHSDKKIVFLAIDGGELIGKHGEIRVFIG